MLPASLRHDCSSASNTVVVPEGRRSSMSDSLRPTVSGNSSSVRPVRSPSMCISTAATTSCGSPSRPGTSSSREMLIWGTLIMIRRLVSCDNAVAACPAPMLATSRRASICSAFRSRTSSIAPPYTSPAASRINAGTPSPMMVAPLNTGSVPCGASNPFTTISCCPNIPSTTTPARRSPSSRTMIGARAGARSLVTPSSRRRCTSGTTWSRSTIASRPSPMVVVRDGDRDAGALALRRQHDFAFGRLAAPPPLGRRLDAVVHGVAQQVHERIAQLVQDRPVELDLLALDPERHLLAELARHVAHQPRKPVEHLPHRRHARLENLRLQVGREARDLDGDVVDRRIAPLGRELTQSPPHRDQLTDQHHETVQPPQVDPDVAAGAPPDRAGVTGCGAGLGRRPTRLGASHRHMRDVARRLERGLDLLRRR